VLIYKKVGWQLRNELITQQAWEDKKLEGLENETKFVRLYS